MSLFRTDDQQGVIRTIQGAGPKGALVDTIVRATGLSGRVTIAVIQELVNEGVVELSSFKGVFGAKKYRLR